MSINNEVKKDITDEDLKAFEEAEEKGEVKTGEERTLEETTEVKSEDKSEETEEEEEEEESSDETAEPSTAEIKEVSGETPREKALRLEVTRLRRKARENSSKEMFQGDKPDNQESEQALKELGYDDDQIKTLDKAFDIIGERKGFVRKDQSYQAMANETLSSFIDEHPEYAAENDKEDIYWGRFNSILKSDYRLAGKTQKQLKSIFEKVDRDVKEELGEKSTSKGKIEAQQQKIKSVSTGASTSKGKTEITEKKTVSGGHPGIKFSGFDDDEIEEFTN